MREQQSTRRSNHVQVPALARWFTIHFVAIKRSEPPSHACGGNIISGEKKVALIDRGIVAECDNLVQRGDTRRVK
jgi:hypothetical protein